MKLVKNLCVIVSVVIALVVFASHAAAQYAANVASYSPGATPAPGGYLNSSTAIGSPARVTGTGSFDSVVSPFSPPFRTTDLVSVGESGHLTLRLSNYAIPQAGGPEIGVFENFGLVDVDFPNGNAGNPAGGFSDPDNALVEVSANGTNWVSLGNVVFDIPANGYTDLTDPFSSTPGSVPSDFQQPFTGGLSSFNGLTYPGMLGLLAGSGGGKWLDISGTGLSQVGFIRFSLADDGNAGKNLNFEIDGVAVSHAALGGVVVPEPATWIVAFLAVTALATRRRRPRR